MTEKSKRPPLSEIEKTSEFQRLTKKQKLFLATYLQGGDAVEAVLAAYQCADWSTARRMSYTLLKNVKIAEVLNLHFCPEPLEKFIAVLNRAIRNKKLTLAQFKALEVKAQSLGFIKASEVINGL